MSYIRSLSNPENLYVWGASDTVNFSWIDLNGEDRQSSMTYEEFNGLFRLLDKDDQYLLHSLSDEAVKFCNVSVREVYYSIAKGDLVANIVDDDSRLTMDEIRDLDTSFFIELTFSDNQKLYLYKTTFYYLYNNVKEDWNESVTFHLREALRKFCLKIKRLF